MRPCNGGVSTNPHAENCVCFALQDVAGSSCAVWFVMFGFYVRGGVSKQGLGFEPNVAVRLLRRTDIDDTHNNHAVIFNLTIIITTVIMLTMFSIIHILGAIMIVIIIVLMFVCTKSARIFD